MEKRFIHTEKLSCNFFSGNYGWIADGVMIDVFVKNKGAPTNKENAKPLPDITYELPYGGKGRNFRATAN